MNTASKIIFLTLFIIGIGSVAAADSVMEIKHFPSHAMWETNKRLVFSIRSPRKRLRLSLHSVSDDNSEWRGLVNGKDSISITRGSGALFGFFSAGEPFAIESFVTRAGKRTRLFIQRAQKNHNLCGVKKTANPHRTTRVSLIKDAPPKTLTLSLVLDASTAARQGKHAKLWGQSLASRMAQVYQRDLNLQVKLQEVKILRNNPSAASIEDMINVLRRSARSWRVSSKADAVHFIFSRTLTDDDVLGLGYLGSTCQYDNGYRYSVAKRVSRSLQSTLLIHEVGHNLNATHSGSGVMQAIVSGPTFFFAEESKSEISQYIQAFMSCL